MTRHEEIFDACARAVAKAYKAEEHRDYAASLDWMATALQGLVRLAEDMGQVPRNYQPRLRSLPALTQKRSEETS